MRLLSMILTRGLIKVLLAGISGGWMPPERETDISRIQMLRWEFGNARYGLLLTLGNMKSTMRIFSVAVL